MKRLRHRLGHWLLRDEPKPEIKLVIKDVAARDIHQMLLKMKRERGGGSLGLS